VIAKVTPLDAREENWMLYSPVCRVESERSECDEAKIAPITTGSKPNRRFADKAAIAFGKRSSLLSLKAGDRIPNKGKGAPCLSTMLRAKTEENDTTLTHPGFRDGNFSL
jgi:hypothetical protein